MAKYETIKIIGDETEIRRLMKNMYPNLDAIRFEYSMLPKPRFIYPNDWKVSIGNLRHGINENKIIAPVDRFDIKCQENVVDVGKRSTIVGAELLCKAKFDTTLDAIVLPVVWFMADEKENKNGELIFKYDEVPILGLSQSELGSLHLDQCNAEGFIQQIAKAEGCKFIAKELEAIHNSLDRQASLGRVVNIWKKCHRYNLFDRLEFSEFLSDITDWNINPNANSFSELIGIVPEFEFVLTNDRYKAFSNLVGSQSKTPVEILSPTSTLGRFFEKLPTECKVAFLDSAEIGRISLANICMGIVYADMTEITDYIDKYPDFFVEFLRNPSFYRSETRPLMTFKHLCSKFESFGLEPRIKQIASLKDVEVSSMLNMTIKDYFDMVENLHTQEGILAAIDILS